MVPINVLASGMMTGVGLSSPATCAAMRCGISAFTETRFRNNAGEWVIGSQVPLEKPWRGIDKLTRLAVPAIKECLQQSKGIASDKIPLFLCVAEPDRPGRIEGLDDQLLQDIQDTLNLSFHKKSKTIALGRVGGAKALEESRQLIHHENAPFCIIVGVDSLLVGPALLTYEAQHRLLTPHNSNGFIPGEAGAAVLLGAPSLAQDGGFQCQGLGFGQEVATISSEKPLRADGLVQAIRAMQVDGSISLNDADYTYSDCNGEQYGFKEDRLAIHRVMRRLKPTFEHYHPADSIGEIGAAVVPCILGLAHTAARKCYAPGPSVYCHVGNDEGDRAAMMFRYAEKAGA